MILILTPFLPISDHGYALSMDAACLFFDLRYGPGPWLLD